MEIKFRYKLYDGATLKWTGTWHNYNEDASNYPDFPVGLHAKDDTLEQWIEAYALKTGYSDSDFATLKIKWKRVAVTDSAF